MIRKKIFIRITHHPVHMKIEKSPKRLRLNSTTMITKQMKLNSLKVFPSRTQKLIRKVSFQSRTLARKKRRNKSKKSTWITFITKMDIFRISQKHYNCLMVSFKTQFKGSSSKIPTKFSQTKNQNHKPMKRRSSIKSFTTSRNKRSKNGTR